MSVRYNKRRVQLSSNITEILSDEEEEERRVEESTTRPSEDRDEVNASSSRKKRSRASSNEDEEHEDVDEPPRTKSSAYFDMERKLNLMKVDLEEANILRRNDAKRAALKIQSLESANEKRLGEMKVLMSEITNLREVVARHKNTKRSLEASGVDRVNALESKIVSLREDLSSARHRATNFEREARRLEQQLERTEVDEERELREKIANLQRKLSIAREEVEEQKNRADGEESTRRLRRELRIMTDRAEEAESRLNNLKPSRELEEKHAVVVTRMERRERSLAARVRHLESCEHAARVASEKINALEAKIERLRSSSERYMNDALETPELRRKLENWKVTMESILRRSARGDDNQSAANAMVTPALVAARVSDLQSQIALLLHAKGDADAAETNSRRAMNETEEKLKRSRDAYASLEKTLQTKIESQRKMRWELVAAEKEKASLHEMLEFYKNSSALRVRNASDSKDDASSAPDDANAATIEMLRKRVADLETMRDETRKEFDKRLESATQQRCSSDAVVESSTRKRSTKIVHFRMNPTATARIERERQDREELKALRQEVSRLREMAASKMATPLVSSTVASTPSSSLSRDGGDLQTRYDRLKEVFRTKMQRFREAVYLLTGFKVDMENTSEEPRLRLRSIYAESERDFLMFQWRKSGIDLCETEAARRDFSEAISLYLQKMNSIPAFLSAVTIQLFEQTTVALNTD